eukprot:gb/GEZN01006214.1/.p1 GENE.gb/GEZN01006214.1/~~gb/GEZN01006214.1/.p1  ORF type:complete len:519 (+),score=49.23 gb/GEZN01006214.1/:44-1558(+)
MSGPLALEAVQADRGGAISSQPEQQAPEIVGNYRLGEVIRLQGSATLRQGEDIKKGEPVTLKILSKDGVSAGVSNIVFAKNELAALTRCEQAQVQHPGIVKLKDAFQSQKNIWIVFEHIEGKDLFSEIEDARGNRLWGGLSRDSVLIVFYKLISTVSYLHQNHISHGNLKPENIMLTTDGSLRLVDFGLATCFTKDKIDSLNFLVENHWGTPHYLAPEVLMDGAFDPFQAEIWSLGVILFTMTCGFRPFAGKNARAITEAIVAGNYPMPTAIDEFLRHLIVNLLLYEPRERMPLAQVEKLLQVVLCEQFKMPPSRLASCSWKPFSIWQQYAKQYTQSLLQQDLAAPTVVHSAKPSSSESCNVPSSLSASHLQSSSETFNVASSLSTSTSSSKPAQAAVRRKELKQDASNASESTEIQSLSNPDDSSFSFSFFTHQHRKCKAGPVGPVGDTPRCESDEETDRPVKLHVKQKEPPNYSNSIALHVVSHAQASCAHKGGSSENWQDV